MELINHCRQPSRLRCESLCRTGELFRLRRVGLGDLVHLRHCLIDLINASGLFPGSCCNFSDEISDSLD
jgi:hypothetical protein